MQYHYAKNHNFEDYASGRVFYARPGQPAFPVRLASEIFQRALMHWQAAGGRLPCTVYDPVCGGGYWLGVLAYLHWDAIAAIYASDIDADVLSLTERNLSLMSPSGLDRRIAELETLQTAYQKASHADALTSAKKFQKQLKDNQRTHAIKTKIFQADAASSETVARWLGHQTVDIIMADIPYGWHSSWVAAGEQDQPPAAQMLQALQSLLKPGALVAIAADKGQKVRGSAQLQRVEHFRVGKRRVFIFQKTG